MNDVSPDANVPEYVSDRIFTRVAGHVFNTPLLPDVAEAIGSYVRCRAKGLKPEVNRFVGRLCLVGQRGDWKGLPQCRHGRHRLILGCGCSDLSH